MTPGPLSPGIFHCDTNFSGGIKYTRSELIQLIKEVGKKCKSIIFTGGEPSLQLDAGLCYQLHEEGYYLAIETNGTKDLSTLNLDWISASPKTAEHTLQLREANELRYVVGVNQALPKPSIPAEYYYLSPVFNPDMSIDYESLTWCMNLIMENPKWSLSTQLQKIWKMR